MALSDMKEKGFITEIRPHAFVGAGIEINRELPPLQVVSLKSREARRASRLEEKQKVK